MERLKKTYVIELENKIRVLLSDYIWTEEESLVVHIRQPHNITIFDIMNIENRSYDFYSAYSKLLKTEEEQNAKTIRYKKEK